jgi:hypothetical protein
MVPERKPTPQPEATNRAEPENKYMQVMNLAWARKRGRGNIEDDLRRPHYEPAKPPAPSEELGS